MGEAESCRGVSGGGEAPPSREAFIIYFNTTSQSHVLMIRRRVMSLLYVAESCLGEAVVLPLTRGKAFVRISAARC